MKTRKLALCVSTWCSEETVHAWVWLKTHLLQAKDPKVVDELFIIHVSQAKGRDRTGQRWDAGGPVIPDVRTAVSGYSAKIIELEGAPGAAIVDFIQKEGIDVVVVGSRGRGNIRRKVLGSVTEYVIRRVKCACLVAGAKVGVGDSFRMKSAAQPLQAPLALNVTGSQPSSPTEGAAAALPRSATRQLSLSAVRLGVSPPHLLASRQPRKPDPTAVGDASIRRIAVVFDNLENGKAVLSWLHQTVLIPADTLFILQWKSFPLASQLRSQQLTGPTPELSSLIEEFVPGHSQVLAHQLQSDKSGITAYVQKEAIDLLVIGTARGRTTRNALPGKRLSTYIYLASPCPCLLVPLGPDGAEDDTDSDVDSADEAHQVFSSDDDYGPSQGLTSPKRTRSASPGRLDSASAHAVSGVPTLVQTVQQNLKRVTSDSSHFAGVKEMLVQLDDRGQITRLTPVSKHTTLAQDLGRVSPGTPSTPNRVLSPAASSATRTDLAMEVHPPVSLTARAHQPTSPDAGPGTPVSPAGALVATNAATGSETILPSAAPAPQDIARVSTPDVHDVPAGDAATDAEAVDKTLESILDEAVGKVDAKASTASASEPAAAAAQDDAQQLVTALQQQLRQKDDEVALLKQQLQRLQDRDQEIALLRQQLDAMKGTQVVEAPAATPAAAAAVKAPAVAAVEAPEMTAVGALGAAAVEAVAAPGAVEAPVVTAVEVPLAVEVVPEAEVQAKDVPVGTAEAKPVPV